MARVKIEKIINNFNALTDKPVKYLTAQNDIKEDVKKLVKSLYDFTKSQEVSGKPKTDEALQKIIVNDFDEEQIWQQIELQNSLCWDQLVWNVANCMSDKNNLMFPINFPIGNDIEGTELEEEIEGNDTPDLNSDASSIVNELPNESEAKKTKTINKGKKSKSIGYKPSIVDDRFFKLCEMESFLVNEEKIEGKKKTTDEDDEETIDMFEDFDSECLDDEGGKEMKYSDFFNEDDDVDHDEDEETENGDHEEDNMISNKKVRFAEPGSDDSNDDNDDDIVKNPVNGELEKDEKTSEFERRQQRIKQQISKLEEKTLTEAPWQLKGEINASKRPQNSLLEEILDFDLTTRPPPIITEETTLTLEGLIRQRIKDKAWDDVVKKEKPVDDQLVFKKPEVLDQAKSKLSLAQVYEAEYLKQKQALSGEVEDEKEPDSHTEIRDAMNKLFAKLDALCHYHYTPKPPQAEIKIVSNTPAISMEEVAPIATSDATLLAPEEVKRKRKGDLMSKEERTQADKNRERRRKKKLQRKKGQVMKVTEHRNTMKGVESNDKSLKTSKAFFQQLNDNTTSLIKQKKNKVIKNKGQ